MMRRARAGFTLLEVVTALAIIALVAVSALATVAQQLNVASRARQVERAEVLATQRLGMMRLLKSYEIQSLPDTIVRGRFAPPNDQFTWRVTSEPVVNEYYLNDVRVEIDWDGGAYVLSSRLYAPLAADTAS